MKILFPKQLFFCLTLFSFFITKTEAQLGFCGGNSGDPIFTEDFGSGTDIGPALPAGTTSYNFTIGTPFDGDYTISSTTNYFDWINVEDHTPGDTNGKSFIVNASFTAGEFYRREINGLCENTTYEFSSWLINLLSTTGCEGNGIPVNVRFEIWDETDTIRLAFGDTGSIFPNANANWEQYALVFITEPGQTSVILKMRNNSNGGCGNDLAIDDILFKSCGDTVTTMTSMGESSLTICEDEGAVSRTITATPDNAVFTSHFYQWQQSTDSQNWTNIPGETNATLTTPTVTTTTYFRALVAEDMLNVNNNLCNVATDVFEVNIIPIPDAPITNGDVFICEGELASLEVTIPNTLTVDWYDAPTGGNLLLENSMVYETSEAGTYFAEANTRNFSCPSATRTAVTLTVNPLPIVSDENLSFCEGTTIVLSAENANLSYAWNTGATTETIEVAEEGTYTVEVFDSNGCSATRTIVLEQIDLPIISTIESDGPSIIVTTANEGSFEYSLDGNTFQSSPTFEAIEGGLYTIYVQDSNACGLTTREFFHLVVPKFFTPNGDNINDVFELEGLDFFNNVEFSIFDRYGKLLKFGNSNTTFWDGNFQGNQMPANDYWYLVKADESFFKGHFTLKR